MKWLPKDVKTYPVNIASPQPMGDIAIALDVVQIKASALRCSVATMA
jgi:ssRNA-specific RNase YbeY (16S rRNA maturation enzyme)